MTLEGARMLAVVSSATHFTARMSKIVSIHRGILGFSAEAKIITRHFFPDRLACHAPPFPALGLRIVDPSLDAVEVLNVEAVGAMPRGLVIADFFAADHALECVVLDIFDELLTLRNF